MSNHSQQYSRVFPQYVEHFGQEWNPTIKLRLLARWNAECQGWQTRYLDGDRYSKRFIGEDGRQYRGFVESGMICDADGETLSRYDGMARLFVEAWAHQHTYFKHEGLAGSESQPMSSHLSGAIFTLLTTPKYSHFWILTVWSEYFSVESGRVEWCFLRWGAWGIGNTTLDDIDTSCLLHSFPNEVSYRCCRANNWYNAEWDG